jgi:predicted RNA-binding protein with PUA-like domain
MQYWLMKTEPDVYSIDMLQTDMTTTWDGVRNYQARNYMMRDMCLGDDVLIYHSNCKQPAIVGEAVVSRTLVVDPSQFDIKSKYYDPKSNPDNPRWYCVEVSFVARYAQPVPLLLLRKTNGLNSMTLLRPSNRLSITPVTVREYQIIKKLRSK